MLETAVKTRLRVERNGTLTWKDGHRKGRWAIKTIGSHGYLCGSISFEGEVYHVLAHECVFILTNGHKATKTIDHINGDKLDNRPSNLREAGQGINTQNSRGRGKNSTGYRGVSPNRKRFSAIIGVNYKNIYLGSFATPEEAAIAYDDAARKYFGPDAYFNFPERFQ